MPNNPYGEDERLGTDIEPPITGWDRESIASAYGAEAAGAFSGDYGSEWANITKEGWYTPSRPGQGGNPYMGGYFTGMPQTKEEAQIIRDYYARTGALPTSGQAGGMLTEQYGAPSVTRNLSYLAGSTPYQMGLGREGESYNPYSGEIESIGGGFTRPGATLQRIRSGAPAPRYQAPTKTSLPDFATGIGNLLSKSQTSAGFTATEQGQYQQYKNALDNLFAQALDRDIIAKGMEFDTQEEADEYARQFFTEKGDEIKQQAIYSMYQNYLTPITAEQEMALVREFMTNPNKVPMNYAEEVAKARAQYTQASQPMGGLAPTPSIPQVSPQQQAEQTNMPVYRNWVDSMPNLDEQNRVWLYNNYSGLVGAWLAYGQGQDFMAWVQDYLAGSYPPQAKQVRSDERRFAPGVRYAR